MLIVEYSDGPFEQTNIRADSIGLEQLATALRTATTVRLSKDLELAETKIHLETLEVFHNTAESLLVTVRLTEAVLMLSASQAVLQIVADNVQSLVGCSEGTHEHVEWYEGNSFIDANSVPVIISRVADSNG